jgi:uncharacterized tellurite resistance protein B-like protein
MNQTDYQKLLLMASVCMMACDGKIHKDEIDEIRKISETTTYFEKIDYAKEIDSIVSDIAKNGKNTIQKLFRTIKENELTHVQELLLVEVLMRIIYADNVKDPNEVMFLNIVRSYLKIHSEMLMQRFGNTDLLFNKDCKEVVKSNEVKKSTQNQFFTNLTLPKLIDFQVSIPDIKLRIKRLNQ